MTEPYDDFEERLRHALRAEADSVDPSPEALENIRARTRRSRFATWFGAPWLRPTLAAAATALIAVSVVLGTPQMRDQILPQSFTDQGGDRDAPARQHDADGPPARPDSDHSTSDGDGGAPPGQGTDPTAEPTSPEEHDSGGDVGITGACTPQQPGEPAPTPTREPGRTAAPDGGEGGAGQDCTPSDGPTSPNDDGTPGPGDGNDDGGDPGDGGDDGGPTPSPGGDPGDGGSDGASGEHGDGDATLK